MPMPISHFRADNLVATIGPPDPVAFTTLCPSRTCCSRFDCAFSVLMPGPEFTPADLSELIQVLRSQLDVERRGIDLALTAASPGEHDEWEKVLTRERVRRVGVVGSP